MKKGRFSEEQIIRILQEGEAGGTKVEICRRYGISEVTYYRWRHLYGGVDMTQLHRLKTLESENGRLRKVVADTVLANEVLKEALEKKGRL